MEPVKIDWENIDSKFVEDDLYEHINAPKWVDFSAPDIPDNDEAWFCRSDCNHPKTVEDFLKSKTPTKKILGIADSSEAKRDLNLKRRALKSEKSQTNPSLKFKEDGENQNPNFSTPLSSLSKSKKAEFKSSDEKKKQVQNLTKIEPMPQLKSTRSARNLFSGRDIIGHVSEFVTELKKLAMKAREGEEKREKGEEKCGEVVDDVRENVEKRPLLEAMHKEKVEAAEKSNNAKEKLKRNKGNENTPISLDLKSVKRKDTEIRTNPPSPQCFLVTREPMKTTPPSRAGKSRLMERGILQELEQGNKEVMKAESINNSNGRRSASNVDAREPRGLDVFWFLKPCTLSSPND